MYQNLLIQRLLTERDLLRFFFFLPLLLSFLAGFQPWSNAVSNVTWLFALAFVVHLDFKAPVSIFFTLKPPFTLRIEYGIYTKPDFSVFKTYFSNNKMEDNRTKPSRKLKYLYNKFSSIDTKKDIIRIDYVKYSINKKNRWDPKEWDKPLVCVDYLNDSAVDLQTNEREPDNLPVEYRDKDKYYYYKGTVPKSDRIFNRFFNFSGAHCLQDTNEKRDRQRRQHKKQKVQLRNEIKMSY